MIAARKRLASPTMVQLAAAVSTVALMVAMPAPAFAQETPPPPPTDEATPPTPGNPDAEAATAPPPATEDSGEIVVTGIRAGIRGAVSIKRREQGIVEAVTAEDIGKLPDISIAESIARLPGLAAQRVNGRAQVISIRGLAPDFTTTLLNGRQQASSGDNRAVEFDQYPSELLSSVVIYKTPDANIAGFGLSGTADLRTVRPLAFGKRAIALNLRGEVNGTEQMNKDVKRWGWRGSASYIDQLTPELGIALGLAYLDSPSSKQHTHSWWFESFAGAEDRISPPETASALFLGGQEAFASSTTNKRLAGMGIVEWEPSDKLHTILDLYYSRFKQRETMRGAQWYSYIWLDNPTITNVTTSEMGGATVATGGTISNWAPIIRNDYNTRDDWLFSAGLNNEYKLTDELSLIADLSYSKNKRIEHITETYAGYGCCVTAADEAANRVFDSLTWDTSGGMPQFTPGLNYADANQVSLGDRDAWGGWGHDGATKAPHVKEQIYSADGDLRYHPAAMPWLEAVDVGANFTRRDKSKFVDEFFLFLKNDRLQTLAGSDILVHPADLSFAGFGNVLAYDVADAMDSYYDFGPTVDSAHFDKTWKIKEDVTTFKARAQFAFGDLHGNLGIQAVHQKQKSTGSRINFTADPVVVEPNTDGDSYWDILPSLNSYYDFGGGHRLRFAAAKVMARPRMDEMRANLTPSFNTNPCGGGGCDPNEPPLEVWSASGGNPRLKPWRATALDLAYEWYIGPASYIAIAGFYKKLDNYIFTRVSKFDFASFPMPAFENPLPPGVTVTTQGDLSMPDNGPGGKVWGVELSGALEFGRLTNLLDGFGVLGSYSRTKSNLNPVDPSPGNPDPVVRIPGLSGTVASLTGYFEKYGFQARVSYRYRSAFKGEVVQLFAVRGFTEVLADKQVDAQVGYTFPETSRYKNLGVLLQVYNLTNSPYRTRVGLDESGKTPEGGVLIDYYEKYGPQYLFGVNYRF